MPKELHAAGGTLHEGSIDAAQTLRRRAKNLRNGSRHGQATRPVGSNHRLTKRLHKAGNRAARGRAR